MPWGLLDDKFHRHPKVRAIRRDGARGREALGVWVYWWSWCLDDEAQNGIVPREELSPGDLKAAALLEERKLWDPVPEGWHIHDFEDYLNGNKHLRDEKREAKREADRVRVAASRAASRANVADVARDTGDISATVADGECDMSPGSMRLVAPLSQPRARALPLPLPAPSPPDPRERSARTVLVQSYQARYESARSMPWMLAGKFASDLDLLARWCADVAGREGRDVDAVIDQLLDAAFASDWLVPLDFSLASIAKQPGALYRPPPKAATGPPKVLNSALIRSCEEAIEAERKKRTPNADTIASLERTVANERAHPSGEPEDHRAAYGRRR